MRKDHEETLKLLPWYVNDTLAGKELEAVLRHLADCRDCQAERDRLYQLQQMVQETETPPADHTLSYQRVMKRINAAEQNRDSTSDVYLPRRRSWVPAGLAASVLSLVVAGSAYLSMVGLNTGTKLNVPTTDVAASDTATGIDDEYQTLSSDALMVSTPGEGRMRRIELGFVSPIPAATLRQALIETNSNIVSGPDSNGKYLVEVMVPGQVTAADFLSGLQGIEGVQAAQFVNE